MVKKKSVLLIGNYPPPFGGVPRHIEYLVPSLIAGGFQVHVVSDGHTGVERYPGLTIYKLSKKNLVFTFLKNSVKSLLLWRHHFSTFGYRSIRQLFGFLSLIAVGGEIIRKHEISIIKAYNLSSYAPIGAVLSMQYGKPLVISNFGEYYSNPMFFQKHHKLIRFTVRQASRRLSMTHHCAAIYDKCEAGLTFDIVYYGIDLNSFNPRNNGSNLRQEIGIQPGDKVILYLARMTKEMGLQIFINAAERCLSQNPHLKVIIGGKPEELLETALKFQSEHPSRVFVRPNIPLDDLPQYYSVATVVAVPTLGDRACGSLSAAEASASARPVVASRIGGIPEFVVDGQTGILVPPGEPNTLADSLLRICQEEKLAQQLGLGSRAFAETNFDKERTNARILEILNAVLDENGTKGGCPPSRS